MNDEIGQRSTGENGTTATCRSRARRGARRGNYRKGAKAPRREEGVPLSGLVAGTLLISLFGAREKRDHLCRTAKAQGELGFFAAW